MTRITPENVHTLPAGARVWVHEWDEAHKVWNRNGILYTELSYPLDPAKLSVYRITPDEPPATSLNVFYHVGFINWLGGVA